MPDQVGRAGGSEERMLVFLCSHCGYAEGNHRNWCNAGCGHDYNHMQPIEVVPASQLDSLALEVERLRAFVADVAKRYRGLGLGVKAERALRDGTVKVESSN